MTTNRQHSNVNLRNIVLEMLLETDKGRKSHLVLRETLDRNTELDKQQRAFITRLYHGTIERRIEIDYIINMFSKISVNKMKPIIRNIIRMSVYQLKYMDSVPVSAVCNEAVKLTSKRKFTNLKAFVNGVVRNISRNIDKIEYPKDQKERMSIVYSVPKWIIEMWSEQYGLSFTEQMLQSFYENKVTTIRCNTGKANVAEIIDNLKYKGVEAVQSPICNEALYISDYDNLQSLEVFHAGMITVQNVSSMLTAISANPNKQDYVIDVCAAPGGKSLHIAEMLDGTGTVEARDLTKSKVQLIDDNIKRMGYGNIITKVMDATKYDRESEKKADIVIADLPCSGLGVLGNKSEIKYNISKEQIYQLAQLQRDILKVVSRYVKPKGKLIFSTCTVNKIENNNNVKWIEENLPFERCSLENLIPKEVDKHNTASEGYVQIFPGQYHMDGFFISAFVRK